MKSIFFSILFIYPFTPLFGKLLTGKITKVIDGDTVILFDTAEKKQVKLKLLGIDAPNKRQPYAKESAKHLAQIILGYQVDVKYQKTDRNGFILGKLLWNKRDINLNQVQSGFAWHDLSMVKDQTEDDEEEYREAERKARKRKLGIWKQKSPTPPWAHQKSKRALASNNTKKKRLKSKSNFLIP